MKIIAITVITTVAMLFGGDTGLDTPPAAAATSDAKCIANAHTARVVGLKAGKNRNTVNAAWAKAAGKCNQRGFSPSPSNPPVVTRSSGTR